MSQTLWLKETFASAFNCRTRPRDRISIGIYFGKHCLERVFKLIFPIIRHYLESASLSDNVTEF